VRRTSLADGEVAYQQPVALPETGSSPVGQPLRRTQQDGGTEWLCPHCECDVLFEPHAATCPTQAKRAISLDGHIGAVR
jgi:hypothetical protein